MFKLIFNCLQNDFKNTEIMSIKGVDCSGDFNAGIQACISAIKDLLNHEPTTSTAVLYYIDSRILASWCFRNNIAKSQLDSSLYQIEDWAMNSINEYKDFVF